jgi:hypothetical protein
MEALSPVRSPALAGIEAVEVEVANLHVEEAVHTAFGEEEEAIALENVEEEEVAVEELLIQVVETLQG